VVRGEICAPPKLIRAAWKAFKFPASTPPWALIRWDIAEQTGWTLEYIDSLDINDIYERSDILTARAQARGNT
jgi:hypothetical protein